MVLATVLPLALSSLFFHSSCFANISSPENRSRGFTPSLFGGSVLWQPLSWSWDCSHPFELSLPSICNVPYVLLSRGDIKPAPGTTCSIPVQCSVRWISVIWHEIAKPITGMYCSCAVCLSLYYDDTVWNTETRRVESSSLTTLRNGTRGGSGSRHQWRNPFSIILTFPTSCRKYEY